MNNLCAPTLGILSSALGLLLLQIRDILEVSNKKFKAVA